MIKIFIGLIVLIVICGFEYVMFLMWQFLKKSEQAMYMFLLTDETTTREELAEIEEKANQALRCYRKMGYIALSVRDMDTYKEQLDNICDEIKQMRVKMV